MMIAIAQESRQIDEKAFPHTGLPSDKLVFLVRYAVLAPSSHNTQPWFFKVKGDTLSLYGDKSRILKVADPEGREMTISCSAALYNLRVAAEYFGYQCDVRLLPEENGPWLLARVSLITWTPPPDKDISQFKSIYTRHTNRMPFFKNDIPSDIIDILSDAARQEGAYLRIISQHEREDVIRLIEEGDRIQEGDKAFREELAQWIYPNRSSRRDGMPGAALGLGEFSSMIAPYFIRRVDMGDRTSARDRELVNHSPLLAVLCTEDDTCYDWLEAGQALERVLLEADANGLACSYMNQPIQVPQLRQKLAVLLQDCTFPQVLLRIGYSREPRIITPRRPLKDVLEVIK
jgi:hypothetical protein